MTGLTDTVKGKLRIFPITWISSKKNKELIEDEIQLLSQDPLFVAGWIHLILVADYQVQRRFVLSQSTFSSMIKSQAVECEVNRKLNGAIEQKVVVMVVLIAGLKNYDYCVIEKVSQSGLVEY